MPDSDPVAFATRVGYALRGVAPSCLLVVRGTPPLFVDLEAHPITVREAACEGAGLELELDPADVAAIGPGMELAVDGWIESGRVVARGSADTVARLRARLRAGFDSVQYAEIDDHITDPRFVFINHGFVELDGPGDFGWVQPGDEPWRYNLNLVREVVRDVPLDGARLLDVGCGRGGACSYFVRYHAPADVVGVDLIPGHVAFCAATHRAGNLRFLQADAQDLPFDEASFDVVTNIESSHCYPRLDAFFAEVRRVLRPGGVFCYADNLPAGRVDARTRRLSAYGEVRRVRVVTAEVAEALRCCREPFLALVGEMTRGGGDHASRVERFAQSILRCRDYYTSGTCDYAIWQMVRP